MEGEGLDPGVEEGVQTAAVVLGIGPSTWEVCGGGGGQGGPSGDRGPLCEGRAEGLPGRLTRGVDALERPEGQGHRGRRTA